MSRIGRAGPKLYASALAGLGLLQLVIGDFLAGLIPVPAALPLRLYWVYVSSAIFLLAAAGIFSRRWRHQAAMLSAGLFFVFFLFLHLPKLLGELYNPNEWSAAFETLIVGSGGVMIALSVPGELRWQRSAIVMEMAGLYLFAMSLVVFGVLHIRYNGYIQTLIPSWLPAHVGLSYLVIAGFLLSALSLLTNLKASLASCLLGMMFLSWVLLLHAPRVFMRPTVESEWTGLFVAAAVSGIGFSLMKARSYTDRKSPLSGAFS